MAAFEAGSRVVWRHPPSSNPTPRIANVNDTDLQYPDLKDARLADADFHEAITNPSPSRRNFR
jgi:hypothetical protein